MSDQQAGNSSELVDSGSSISYTTSLSSQVAQSPERNEQVRSRWTPKPEQILILESIFNSGMVNPPKDETIKIRRLLERFGPVGDANVFYWFQNRRSRSRRRQRQMQAATNYMEANNNARNPNLFDPTSSNFNNNPSNNMLLPIASGFVSSGSNAAAAAVPAGGASSLIQPFSIIPSSSENLKVYTSSKLCEGFDGDGGQFFSEMGFGTEENIGSQAVASSLLCTSDHVTVQEMLYQQQQPAGVEGSGGFVTVFINGVQTEVPRGPLDMKAMCGQDFLLVHSSGHPVPINEYGFSVHGLQHGESYFLVAKSI